MTCEMEVTPPLGTPLDPPGYYRVTWSVTNVCPEGQAAELTSLTLNGEPVEYDPGPITTVNGTFLVPIGTPTDEWCINASNSCGHSVECCDEVPCCYKTSMVAIEARGYIAEYAKTCTQSRRWIDGTSPGWDVSETVYVRGLDQLNGTILREPIELGGYDTGYSCQSICHRMEYPIRLGVYGEVEWRQTWTDTRGGTNGCGEDLLGSVIKYYKKWNGELAFSCVAGVETILLLTETVQYIVKRGRTGPTFCPPDPLAACGTDGAVWTEDSDYCLYTKNRPFTPAHPESPPDANLILSRMLDSEETMGPYECDRSTWYTPCSGGDWCTSQVEAIVAPPVGVAYNISELCDYSSVFPSENPTCSTSPYCIWGYAEMKPLYNA
jgi:hypothetical protein